jgi:prepilin-type N-terminal cleavage/methylation domain-containing protein
MAKQRGFTLIELLVVVAIIGLLSSIVIASLNTARQKGRDARRAADLKQILSASEMFNDAKSSYPSSTSAGYLVSNGYIGVVPVDPKTGVAYTYVGLSPSAGAVCTGLHLGSIFELATSQGLANDSDTATSSVCTGSATDFNGTSAVCDGTAGTPAPGGTERCYDIKL